VTLEHFLVGLGLHNITGLKRPIKVLSHLGHCRDYNLVYEVETVQVEMNLKALKENVFGFSNVNKACETERQLTYWWANNLQTGKTVKIIFINCPPHPTPQPHIIIYIF